MCSHLGNLGAGGRGGHFVSKSGLAALGLNSENENIWYNREIVYLHFNYRGVTAGHVSYLNLLGDSCSTCWTLDINPGTLFFAWNTFGTDKWQIKSVKNESKL